MRRRHQLPACMDIHRFMYMFAALLAAVAHYIYFRFIDHGYVINTCETMVDTLAQSNMPEMDSYIATYQEALETARLLSPIDITLQMISSNVFGVRYWLSPPPCS